MNYKEFEQKVDDFVAHWFDEIENKNKTTEDLVWVLLKRGDDELKNEEVEKAYIYFSAGYIETCLTPGAIEKNTPKGIRLLQLLKRMEHCCIALENFTDAKEWRDQYRGIQPSNASNFLNKKGPAIAETTNTIDKSDLPSPRSPSLR